MERNQDYEPNRETDKYILDRLLENLPGMRPDTDPGRAPAFSPKAPRPSQGSPTIKMETRKSGGYGRSGPGRLWDGEPSLSQELQGWEKFEKDLSEGLPSEGRGYYRRQDSPNQYFGRAARERLGWPVHKLSPQEKKEIEELESLLAERATAPGAQKNREGRIQELIEALDFTNPESAGRAFLRELKRRVVDDRLPRIQSGWKSAPGEEVLKDKLAEMELADTPRNRSAAMQALGWSGIPKTAKLKDDSGNPVPLYVDEMKANREAAAEKAYMQHRRDPMKDTPERD